MKFTFLVFSIFLSVGAINAQDYGSLIGVRVSPETAAVTGKIPLDDRNVLEGAVGIFTPQPDYTVGASAAYHRQFMLNYSRTFQAYLGGGVAGVFGDESALGISGNAGIMWIYKRINIGVDAYPTYFFNDVLELRPLYGVHLRYVGF